jgi:hypothetical protein
MPAVMSESGAPHLTGGPSGLSPVKLMMPLIACATRSKPRRLRYGPVRPKPESEQ